MPDPSHVPRALRRTTPVVIAAQIASQVVTIAVLAVLYRELGPEPYGLLGMVLPLFLLVRIVLTGGLDVVTIQQAELDDRQISALFWVNQGLGVGTALATAAAAPLVAWFYGEAELRGLTLALAGTCVAAAWTTQHQALLGRKLRLGTLAVVRLSALALAGIAAVAAALAGWGVWALVVQQYAELVALALLAWIAEPWRPKFVLRGTGGRRLVGFGGHYTTSNLMFYLIGNVDKVLVGYFLGPEALGLYGQAFNVMTKPVGVVIGPLTGIMLPALSRAWEDRARYGELLLGFLRFIALAMLPAGVGLAVVAPETMRVLGGQQWERAGPVLGILALAIPAQGIVRALGSVFASAGHARRLSAASTAIAAALTVAFAVGLWLGTAAGRPLVALAAAYTATLSIIVLPAYFAVAMATVGVRLRSALRQFQAVAPAAGMMGVAVLAVHWYLPWRSDLALLAAEVAVGVLVYGVFSAGELRRLLGQAGRADR